MKDLLKKSFGIDPETIKQLDGYSNQNYRIQTLKKDFIYKTYPFTKEMYDITAAENDALIHLNGQGFKGIPKPIKNLNGDAFSIDQKANKITRLLTYVDGQFLGDVEHSESLMMSLGSYLAKLNLKLQGFDSYVLQARKWPWDLQNVELNKEFVEDIPKAHDRSIVEYFFLQYEEHVRPVLPNLRKQIIHNDANEWNVLTKDGQVSGIIDFGDIAHSHLINEVAIALTYACYDKEDPLKWAYYVLKGYHQVMPLEEQEIAILYYLIAARLCTSVCNSANARKTDPENSYASISENNAWQMLHKWLAIGPIQAEQHFRKAIGLNNKSVPLLDTLISDRQQNISSILSMSYNRPIHMEKAAFQYMYGSDGTTFLDAYNNIPHVGHSHPKVVQAGQRQMAELNTNTRYLFDQLTSYAEKLLSKFPDSLNKVFFVNSGSAASDLAIRMANFHTKRKHIMVMEDGYHGNTQVSIDISDYKFNNPKGQGQKEHIIKTAIPDTYGGKYTSGESNAGVLYGKDAAEEIKTVEEPISAFICEPIVGCAGQVPLPSGYLKEVYPAIRAQGGICISDEVQTGFGRVGNAFWGYELQDVVPDMVILGKPIANGHPMGAVVCTDEIAQSFEHGVEFFSSFGGNPVSCEIANAVLDVIEEEDLQLNAKIVGDYYQSRLLDLASNYACIGDVRGSGLFIGIEIVKEGSKRPNKELAAHIKNELRERNILISTDGPHNNVIKTKPPLCFSKENVDTVVNAIDEVLQLYHKQ